MELFDLIIVGAGPAGITAAVYAARQQLKTLIITDNIGGQAATSGKIENYTGFQFISGVDLAETFEKHVRSYSGQGVEIKIGQPVRSLKKIKQGFEATTEWGNYQGKALLIASGKKSKELNVPGAEEFRYKGVSYCATCDGPLFKGQPVAVIGGGNSALDATAQLVNYTKHVYLIHQEEKLMGDATLIERVKQTDNVTILNNAVCEKISGDQVVTGLTYARSGQSHALAVKAVFVEIGLVPNSDFGLDIPCNTRGEIIVDQHNRTKMPGVFAAGDVTEVPEKQIIVAAGDGAKAALSAIKHIFRNQAQNIPPQSQWRCTICNYIYDPAEHDHLSFSKLDDDWKCPVCGVGKDQFVPL